LTSDRQAHAVVQTLALLRVEGWSPTGEHVAALETLARGGVSFTEYLHPFRARHLPAAPARRRWRLRRVPYLIPGTKVLRNEFGVESADVLADLEFVATAGRMIGWWHELTTGRPSLDVRTLHRHLFADVYSWAGELRTTELRRGASAFAWQSALAAGLARLDQAVEHVVNLGADQDGPRLEYALARLYADFNQLHPFREGNGRVGALLLHGVTMRCGRVLDLSGLTRQEWYAAAADSMPYRRDGRASHRPFLYLLQGRTAP
jgi:cell filamentation protein